MGSSGSEQSTQLCKHLAVLGSIGPSFAPMTSVRDATRTGTPSMMTTVNALGEVVVAQLSAIAARDAAESVEVAGVERHVENSPILPTSVPPVAQAAGRPRHRRGLRHVGALSSRRATANRLRLSRSATAARQSTSAVGRAAPRMAPAIPPTRRYLTSWRRRCAMMRGSSGAGSELACADGPCRRSSRFARAGELPAQHRCPSVPTGSCTSARER